MKRDPGGVPQDFLTLLLRAEGPEGLTRAEVEDNIITFIGAGHETTARALGWTIYCLAEAPWERDKVEQEIRRRRGSASPIRPGGWTPCPSPARPSRRRSGSIRRRPPSTVKPIEPETWSGLYIPKYAAVLVMPWVVHRHRKLWDRPNAFMPERFHPENRDKIDRFQYLPFGAGPRVCIGASFAMQGSDRRAGDPVVAIPL
ncbi:cytochrome P450 [Mesorhizobium atlanticum]